MKRYKVTFKVGNSIISVVGYGTWTTQAIWDARMCNPSVKYGTVVSIEKLNKV